MVLLLSLHLPSGCHCSQRHHFMSCIISYPLRRLLVGAGLIAMPVHGRLADSHGGFDHEVNVFHMHAVGLHAVLLFSGESEHTGDKLTTVMMHMQHS